MNWLLAHMDDSGWLSIVTSSFSELVEFEDNF